MYRNTYIEINTNIIKNNVKNIIKNNQDYEYFIGVVKGNAYGHGEEISKYIVEAGINYLAVSNLSEGLEVRKYVETPILCLEPIDIDYIDLAIQNNITLCISNYDYYMQVKNLNKKIKFHLKLNTGMNRLGIKDKDVVEKIFEDSQKDENMEMEGIFSHLATSGVYDIYYKKQVENFKNLLSKVDLSKVKIVHLGRSCTLDFYSKIDFCNGIRIGIMMYGVGSTFPSFGGLKGKLRKIKFDNFRKKNNLGELNLNRKIEVAGALSLYSEVIDIQKVSASEIVGYGTTYKANKDCLVATIPLGYADGIHTKYNNLSVKINGKKYKVIGTINMGMICIEVDESVHVKDKVLFIDKDISYKTYGNIFGCGPYVFLTTLGKDLPRKYISENE